MALRYSSEMLFSVSGHKKAVTYITEKIWVLTKHHSGMSYRAVALEFNCNEYILNKVSLNKSTHPVFCLGVMIQYSLIQCSQWRIIWRIKRTNCVYIHKWYKFIKRALKLAIVIVFISSMDICWIFTLYWHQTWLKIQC